MTIEKQSTDTVLMVSPDTFQFNTQTAETNAFQHKANTASSATVQAALAEFKEMVAELRRHHIRVLILPSRTDIDTPDAVFPNNWFSTHVEPDSTQIVVLYPMLAHSRRDERQWPALEAILNIKNVELKDLTEYESQQKYLEGTGSLVLDRVDKLAYAALSPRTHEEVLQEFCHQMHYTAVEFHSVDKNNKPIYHTNVVMSIGSDFAVVAAETILDELEREHVLSALKISGKKIIEITSTQMEQMAGNILEVCTQDGEIKIVMSQTARNAFTPDQLRQLSVFGDLIVVRIDTIEKLGGGSARCMMAEIFHP